MRRAGLEWDKGGDYDAVEVTAQTDHLFMTIGRIGSANINRLLGMGLPLSQERGSTNHPEMVVATASRTTVVSQHAPHQPQERSSDRQVKARGQGTRLSRALPEIPRWICSGR